MHWEFPAADFLFFFKCVNVKVVTREDNVKNPGEGSDGSGPQREGEQRSRDTGR